VTSLEPPSLTIVDPRGEPRFAPIELAARPAHLDIGRVLLFDNGKLHPSMGPFEAIFRALSSTLATRFGHLSVCTVRQDLMELDRPATTQLAAQLAADGWRGAVIALCDSGVTLSTILFAAELERAGVPTVTLCQQSALELAAMSAAHVAPGLPLVALPTPRSGTPAQVAAATAALFDDVVAALTLAADVLLERAGAQAQRMVPGLTNRAGMLVLDGAPDLSDEEVLYERLSDACMTDGLPIIAPTPARVARMLCWTDRSPEQVLVEQLPPSGAAVTVASLAAAAVMAGCRAEYFPLLVSVLEAMADESYRLFQAVITSHPGGNAIVVSGPLARELGVASGGGCLGPGFRANATIGRAISLCLLNVSRALPGRSDLAVFGSPAEFTYCFAEATERTPWLPRHTELFDATTTSVTVHRCEAPHNVVDYLSRTPEGVLGTVASVSATLGGNNAYVSGELLVILGPEHAEIMARAGWSKRDVQTFLYEHVRLPAQDLAGRGVPPIPPRSLLPNSEVRLIATPSDVIVVVAGGDGPHSMVGIPWGFARAVTRPVARLDGRPIRSLADMRPA
jgi:hypothetical protein